MKGKLKWVVIIIVVLVLIGSLAGSDDSNEPKKTGKVTSSNEGGDASNQEKEEEKQTVFKVGDIVETDDLKISYLAAKKYKSDNQFLQPKKGYTYYRMEFEFENISDTDQSVSSLLSWNCYADGYAMEQSYIGDDDISSELSPGKKARGSVYYEIPKKAKEVVLEIDADFWTNKKIVFQVK